MDLWCSRGPRPDNCQMCADGDTEPRRGADRPPKEMSRPGRGFLDCLDLIFRSLRTGVRRLYFALGSVLLVAVGAVVIPVTEPLPHTC